jgi:hypothetical protein
VYSKYDWTSDLPPVPIDTAYLWLCKQRANFSANAYIRHLPSNWQSVRQDRIQALNKRDYTLSIQMFKQSEYKETRFKKVAPI